MNESDTRLKKIDPALKAAGWLTVPESDIFTEQSAYVIAPGRVTKAERNPKKIDYLLTYKGIKIAIVEAKSDELDVSAGVAQAKEYAGLMNIRFTYSTNGNEIYAIDMKTGWEGLIDSFPSPDELWQKLFPEKNELRDKFNSIPFNRDGGRSPRYYQEIAINKTMETVANSKNRMLLTLATGTGKTYIAFQIAWKLFYARWNIENADRRPRILFLADRNILANQAINDFSQFDADAMVRITPDEIRKNKGKVPTAQHLYFTIFQTFMTGETPVYKQYPKNFFDFIIIDECHRGGANDESEWRTLMNYFEPAYQLGLTATPRRDYNADTYKYFGEPLYVYSLKQGIADGYLTPFRVCSAENLMPDYKYEEGDIVYDPDDNFDEEKIYTEKDFYFGRIEIKQRDELRVKALMKKINQSDKSIVFCYTQDHANKIRDMINRNKDSDKPNYCVRVTANDGAVGEQWLKAFQDNEKTLPAILTTSQKLSTGVDARNVRNIVLMRPVNNMIEFKQIIGRGTRLFDDKYYFTIYDFVGASAKFNDPEWDGEPICSKCGNFPCTCKRGGNEGEDSEVCPKCGKNPCVCESEPPKPCPVCGNSPCTCEGSGGKKRIEITLPNGRVEQIENNAEWNERFMYDGKLITLKEFLEILFRKLPSCFESESDLKKRWADPNTRTELLEHLENEGYPLEKLQQIQRLMDAENCDLLDVLEYIAYNTEKRERSKRVALAKPAIFGFMPKDSARVEFTEFVLDQYIREGYAQLSLENLSKLIGLKYGSVNDGISKLGTLAQIKNDYLNMQQLLYA